MSGFARATVDSFLKRLIPVVTLALFLAPSAAGAELFLQQHDVWKSHFVPETPRQTARRPVFCLKENGDLVIRRRDVSLIMGYALPNDFIEPKERLRIAQRQDCLSISGISLKLSLQF